MIYYATLDPERAMGLAEIGVEHAIICPYKSQLTDALRRASEKVIILEEETKGAALKKIVQRGTYGILHFVSGRKIIAKNDCVMVLKNSQLIEDFCKKQGWKLLAPKAKVAEQFENKISQYKILETTVPYPPTFIADVGSIYNHDSRFIIHNSSFVLQFNRGHSGNSTFFIKSKNDLVKLAKKFPKREVKISEYIKGKTYTLNCLVLKSGEVVTGSLSEQITGLESATNNPNTTCGNDFVSPRKLSKKQIKRIQQIAENTGAALHKKGYRGLFGIDAIISMARNRRGTSTRLPASRQGTDAETAGVYFIEVNTHQPASIPFETKLHRKVGKVPLLEYFILDSLGARIKPSRRDLAPIILPISAKQIIYRNKTPKVLTRSDIEDEYKGETLISRMRYIKPNEEIFRKQQGIHD